MCFGGSSASNRGSVSSSRSGTGRTSSRTRSAGRGSGANKNIRQFRQSAVSNVTTDLKMGLSTFGMNKADQAAKLSQMGYSPRAIDSYQARTAASAARRSERLASRGSGGDDDNRPAPARVLAPARAGSNLPVRTSLTPTPPPAPSADAEPEPGSAEEAVVEGAKTRKGRASTIATSPTGLLTTARTRRRRSLMGGEEPMGLIE